MNSSQGRHPIAEGLRDGIPIALGYFAVSFSLGIIAQKAGLVSLQGFFSSFFTRASAGEYAVYSLIAVGAAYAEVALVCIIVNLRYILMSAALTQKSSPATPLWQRLLLGCCITDEIFGISVACKGYLTPSYTFSAAILSALFWAAGTATGIFAGDILPANVVTALSVALYGMFIAIIIPPAKRDRAVLVAVIISFVLSGCWKAVPALSGISSGMKIIILTILISTIAAIVRPIALHEEKSEH